MRRPALALAGILLCGSAVFCLRQEIATYPLVDAAEVIRSSERIPVASDDMQEAMRIAVDDAAGCRQQSARARVTVGLFLLRRAVEDERDLNVREERFEAARSALGTALRCDPSNGQFWALRSAMEGLAAYEPNRYAEMMAMSVRTAPYERSAFLARWKSMAPLPGVGDLLRNGVLKDDLVHALQRLPPLDAISVIEAFPAVSWSSRLAPLVDGLSPQRREALQAEARQAKVSAVNEFLTARR